MSFKSFLNWLGSDESAKSSSPNKETGDWSEKRKQNRVDLESDRRLTVHLLSPEANDTATTLVAKVRNVSVRGCGLVFEKKADAAKLQMGQKFVASLAVDDFSIPLHVDVVRVGPEGEAAIRFRAPFPKELEKLERFLEPRCLGRSLREIDPAALQKEPGKELRWFQGVNETNLFSWLDLTTQEVNQQQLVFLENIVEWKVGGTLRTGRVRSDRTTGGWVRTELVDFTAVPDKGVLQQARTLVESAQIDSAIKQIFLKQISQ